MKLRKRIHRFFMHSPVFGKIWLTCPQIHDFIMDYLEGRLPKWVRWSFNFHIIFCKNCRYYVRLYRSAARGDEFIKENPVPEELSRLTYSFLEKEGIISSEAEGK